jgi:putative ABC transport system substrate-binding protein
MFVQPDQYISMFKSMKIRRVGVVYNEEKSGWYLQLAGKAAREAGIELVVREISAPQESVAQLATLAGKVDALWMLPDTTAVTRETSEAYFRFGLQNSVPVISFAPNYLGLGAAAVLEIDRVAMGQQAFALAAQLLNERNNIPPVELCKGAAVKTNPVV